MNALVKSNGVSQYSGIVGLRGRPPITAVLTTKRKEDFGKREIAKRFYLVDPRRNDRGIRELSKVFNFFNNAPEAESRVIRGIILHPYMEKCFHSNLRAQQLPADYYRHRGIQIPVSQTTKGVQTKGHPNEKPCCVGNGLYATRWQGKNADDFEDIKCPNERCEFRLGKQKWCKPHMTFLFALRWEDPTLPSGIIRFDSASWYTCSNFYGEEEEIRGDKKVIVKQGFFGLLDNLAKSAGMDEATVFGVPFVMNVSYETKKDGETTWKFPVVYIAPEMSLGPVKFFKEMRNDMKMLRDINPISVEEEIEREPSVLDIPGHNPLKIGNAPANGTKIIDVEPDAVIEPDELPKKPPTTPDKPRKNQTGQPSKTGSSSNGGAVANDSQGKNGQSKLFPTTWAADREKMVKRIGSPWKKISEETLGNNILLGTDKDIAIAELRFRIVAWQKLFAELDAADEWKTLTIGGDILKIPEAPMKGDEDKTCLASVAAKLRARWSSLKEQRQAA